MEKVKMIVSDEDAKYFIFYIDKAEFTNTKIYETSFTIDDPIASHKVEKETNSFNKNGLRIDVKIKIDEENIIEKLKQLNNDARIKAYFDNFEFNDGNSFLTIQGRINFIRIVDDYVWLTFNQFNYMKTKEGAWKREYNAYYKKWKEWEEIRNENELKELPVNVSVFNV